MKQNEAIIEGLVCILKMFIYEPDWSTEKIRGEYEEARKKYIKSTIKLLEECK